MYSSMRKDSFLEVEDGAKFCNVNKHFVCISNFYNTTLLS